MEKRQWDSRNLGGLDTDYIVLFKEQQGGERRSEAIFSDTCVGRVNWLW
jgi:hypothetical protein